MTVVSSPSRQRATLLPLLLVTFSIAVGLPAEDWPQYRGPNHDGASSEIIRTNWSELPPRQVWKVSLGPALSSLAISGGRVFTQARRPAGNQDTEYCVALNADTGAQLWATPLDVANYPNAGVGSDDGPRSTPAVDGDRVYVLTSYLRLACLNAATGLAVWSKDLKAEYGGTVIAWQNAASPLVIGDHVIVNCNGPNQCLLALHKLDGSLAWKGQDDRMTHATPVAATIGGVQQVIFFAQSGLVSVVPETGSVLWRDRLNYNGISVAASPVVAGDQVYASRAYPASLTSALAGAAVVSVTNSGGTFSAAKVWYRTNQLMNHWCTPVHYNGHLYGIYGQGVLEFKCVEMATGIAKWSVAGFGYGSALAVGRNILALADNGNLVLVDPNPAAYTEIARHRPLTGKCWNVAAVSNGRIYLRSTTEAVCLDVAPALPPRLRLTPMFDGSPNGFRLFLGNEDGSPIDPTRVSNIGIFNSTNLMLGIPGWVKLTNSLVLTNGQLRLDEPPISDAPFRFFRAEEQR